MNIRGEVTYLITLKLGNNDMINANIKRLLGLIAFIATGGGLIISTAINEENLYKTEILLVIGCFFAISLIDHYRNLRDKEDLDEN